MSIKNVYSVNRTAEEVVSDIRNQLNNFNIKMLIYFASSIFEQDELSKQMQDAFGSSLVFGCSTAGEIISGQLLENSVVAMAFDSDTIEDAKLEVVENVKDSSLVKKAFENFEKYYNESMETINFKKYLGIILVDGLSSSEEKIMDKLGDLTNVTFIGGSAGDDAKFTKTYVYTDGKAYSNAAILVLLKPKGDFGFIKTQSFCPTNCKLVATKVNEEERIVYEFNNKPAVQAYAEALGIPTEELPNRFSSNPVGLVAENDYYVRSPQRIIDENGIKFYCNILEGMEVTLLENTDIIGDTRKAIDDKRNELGGISGIINFNCILRTLELIQRGQTDEYGKLFSDIPTIGFSTYGEQYIGHINQTATMVVFK